MHENIFEKLARIERLLYEVQDLVNAMPPSAVADADEDFHLGFELFHAQSTVSTIARMVAEIPGVRR